jgi:hypothetical protein
MSSFGIAQIGVDPERLPQRQSWVGEVRSDSGICTVTLMLHGEAALTVACTHILPKTCLAWAPPGPLSIAERRNARRSGRRLAERVRPGAELIAALVLSLRLWGVIWLVVSFPHWLGFGRHSVGLRQLVIDGSDEILTRGRQQHSAAPPRLTFG